MYSLGRALFPQICPLASRSVCPSFFGLLSCHSRVPHIAFQAFLFSFLSVGTCLHCPRHQNVYTSASGVSEITRLPLIPCRSRARTRGEKGKVGPRSVVNKYESRKREVHTMKLVRKK